MPNGQDIPKFEETFDIDSPEAQNILAQRQTQGLEPGEQTPEFEEAIEVPEKKRGTFEALLRGLAQGGTFGFADEIKAFLTSLGATAPGEVPGVFQPTIQIREPGAPQPTFPQALGIEREELRQTREQSPKATITGEAIGGILSSFIPGFGVAAKGAKALNAAKATALAGLAGLGETEAKTLKGKAADVAQSAAGGALLLGAGRALTGGAQKFLEKVSKESGRRAIGLPSSFIKKQLLKRESGEKALDRIDDLTLNEVIKNPFTSTKKRLITARLINKRSGKDIGNIIDDLDKRGVKAFEPSAIVTDIERTQKERIDPILGRFKESELFKSLQKQQQKVFNLLQQGKGVVSFREAKDLKDTLGSFTFRPDTSTKANREVAGQAWRFVSDALNKSIDDAGQAIGDPDLLQKWLRANERFSASSHIEKALAAKEASRIGSKQSFPFTVRDFVFSSAGGAGVGGLFGTEAIPLGVAGGVALGTAARRFGAPLAAKTAQVVETGIKPITQILQKSGKKFGKFELPLKGALARGGTQGLNAAIFVLQQRDPEFRKRIQDLQDKEAEE
jgi:hypothetical protein